MPEETASEPRPTPTHLPEPLVSPGAVAQALGCSEALLEKWRRLGGGPPFVRLGTAIRYRPSAIREFIEARETGGGAGR